MNPLCLCACCHVACSNVSDLDLMKVRNRTLPDHKIIPRSIVPLVSLLRFSLIQFPPLEWPNASRVCATLSPSSAAPVFRGLPSKLLATLSITNLRLCIMLHIPRNWLHCPCAACCEQQPSTASTKRKQCLQQLHAIAASKCRASEGDFQELGHQLVHRILRGNDCFYHVGRS